jgi:muramoyltetrapeptide carboxypeptidase
MYGIKPGDTIGIVSPSAPIAGYCPKRLERGVHVLEVLGYKVKIGENVSKISGYTAGTVAERVSDIHNMFTDKEVRAIIATIGGYSANDLLDKLDYKLIADNNKLFIGYSDITVLHSAFSKKSGIKTIMGPMILPQFGEFPELQAFTKDSFQTVIQKIGSGEKYFFPKSEQWTEEMLFWDKDDIRARETEKNDGWKIINAGKTRGKLIAGNLNTLTKLIGTPYLFDMNDAIFFLEDDDCEFPATIQRMLLQLRQAGLLNGVRGFIFGRFQKKSGVTEEKIKNIFEVLYESVTVPVIMGVDFGHTDPMISLPIGSDVEVDTEKKEIVAIL